MQTDFVIIKLNNRQYMVKKGDKLDVEKIEGKAGKKLTVKEVLFSQKSDKITIGTPMIKGAQVEAKIIRQFKGKKIKVFKYRAKSRYRKTKGHRQNLTQIEITKV